MKAFYDDDYCTLFHAKAEDVLPTLDAVDHVITDPPFGDETHQGARTHAKQGTPSPDGKRRLVGKGEKFINFDSMTLEEVRTYFDLIGPLVRQWCISFMEWRYIASMEAEPPIGLRFVRFGVWVKPNGAPQFTGDRPGTGWEAIGIWHKAGGRMEWNDGGRTAVWTCNTAFSGPAGHVRLHPTEKPLRLLKQIVTQFTDPGDTILDCFAGSGTTGVAAAMLGRKAILVEQDLGYCRVAAKRLGQVQAQADWLLDATPEGTL